MHQADRFEQLAQTVQSKKVGLQRQKDIVHRRQRVDRQDAERRRAIDQHVVEVVLRLRRAYRAGSLRGRRRRPARPPPRPGRCATRQPKGSSPASAPRPALPEIGDPRFFGEQVVHRRHGGLRVEPEVERRVRLRIDIDQPDTLPSPRSAALRFTAVVVLPTPPF